MKPFSRLIVLAALAAGGASFFFPLQASENVRIASLRAPAGPVGTYVADQVIVQFRRGADDATSPASPARRARRASAAAASAGGIS